MINQQVSPENRYWGEKKNRQRLSRDSPETHWNFDGASKQARVKQNMQAVLKTEEKH
jgi:hypothetical protein